MNHDGHQGGTVHLIAHYKVCNHFTKKPARTTTMKSSQKVSLLAKQDYSVCS
jgi:hypothetical protein